MTDGMHDDTTAQRQGKPPHRDEPEMTASGPLDPWMLAVARDAVDELDAEIDVPRAMMWARIARERREAADAVAMHQAAALAPRRGGHALAKWSRQIVAVAAVLVAGVAIGRYVVPADSAFAVATRDTATTPAGLGPDALAAMTPSTDPARVAMHEHLVRTVSLLTVVRDDNPALGPGADITIVARELLSTTRLLLDQPELRDERTRRLLQDLELVLVQVIQARGSAPDTQRAPKETLQDTNLLTRVRAIVTASSGIDEAIYGGD